MTRWPLVGAQDAMFLENFITKHCEEENQTLSQIQKTHLGQRVIITSPDEWNSSINPRLRKEYANLLRTIVQEEWKFRVL